MKEKAKERAVEIEVTPEQKEQIEKLTGKQVHRVKLDPEPLEERVPPRVVVN